MSYDPEKPDSNGPPESLDEQLVAYLDGELDEETTRQLEGRLACEAEVRKQLTDLERTWDMLETLDQADVEETFVQTTMEMVAVEAEGNIQQQLDEEPANQRRRWIAAASVALLATAGGFLLMLPLAPNPNKALLEDLPVLENYDQYRQIQEIEFLKLIQEEESELNLPEVDDAR